MKTMKDDLGNEIIPWIIVKEKFRPIMEQLYGAIDTFHLFYLNEDQKQEFLNILCQENSIQNGIGKKIKDAKYEILLTLTVKKVD